SGGRPRDSGLPPRSGGDAGPRPDSGLGPDAGVVVETPCETGADCTNGLCDRIAGHCVACRTTLDCSDGQRCDDGRCVATEPCQSDLACTSLGRVCDAEGARCVECNTAAECGDRPCLGHSCIDTKACTSSLECAELHMVCGQALPPAWPQSYAGQGCAECNSASDCGAREVCAERFCEAACVELVCGSDRGVECGTCPEGQFGPGYCVDGRWCAAPITFGEVSLHARSGDWIFVGADGRSGGISIDAISPPPAQVRPIIPRPLGAEGYLDGLAANTTHLYWALTDGSIWRRPLGGTQSERFTDVPGIAEGSTSVWCQGLAVTDAWVVCDLVDYDGRVSNGLYRFATSGGAGERFDGAAQVELFVDGGFAYVGDFNGVRLARVDIATGQRTPLLSVQAERLLGVVGGHLYFTTYEGNFRVPTGGGPVEELFAGEGLRVAAVSAASLWVTSTEGLDLWRTALDGTNRERVLTAGTLPVEDTFVWDVVERSDGIYVIGRNGVLALTR
ncbi:hypothetical protein L6R52_02690, partial [Myxococcota bacterium]|nr:hypothetical protein [Myxococcota bacterium]